MCIQWRGVQASRLMLFYDGAECRHWTRLLKFPANEDGVMTFMIRPTAMGSALQVLEDMPSVVLFQNKQIATCLFNMLDGPLARCIRRARDAAPEPTAGTVLEGGLEPGVAAAAGCTSC
jgi:hypothetical protein